MRKVISIRHSTQLDLESWENIDIKVNAPSDAPGFVEVAKSATSRFFGVFSSLVSDPDPKEYLFHWKGTSYRYTNGNGLALLLSKISKESTQEEKVQLHSALRRMESSILATPGRFPECCLGVVRIRSNFLHIDTNSESKRVSSL
jgi:hypothetical protein